jgi:lysophospholipase L1-like esterase
VVDAKPASVFVMIGTNDIEFGRSPEAITANVADIVDKLATGVPGVKIYVESLLPRQPQFDEKVRAVNKRLTELALKRGVTYVDLYPRFVANGRLDPKLTNDDIHLAGEGYARWRDAISTYVSASENRG